MRSPSWSVKKQSALRKQARQQRLKLKGVVQAVETKNEVLQLQCSAAEVGQQKLTRALDAQRTKGQSLLEQREELQREREFLQNELLEKDDALGVAQQAAKLVEAEQMMLADARKAEAKKHSSELKVIQKQKLGVDNKLQALKQRVTYMGKQLAKLQDDLRAAISVRKPSPFLILFCPFQNKLCFPSFVSFLRTKERQKQNAGKQS